MGQLVSGFIGAGPYNSGSVVPIQVDVQGRLVTVGGGGGGSSVVEGADTPSDVFANPTDAVTTWSLAGMWNGATWQRQQATILNADIDDVRSALIVAAPGYSKKDASDWIPNPAATYDDALPPAAGGVPYIITLPTIYDGTLNRRQAGDTNGNARVIGGSPPATGTLGSPSDYAAASATVITGIIKASAGRLMALDFEALVTLGGILQLFNQTGALSGGETAVKQWIIPVNSFFVKQLGREYFGDFGRVFTTGIVWGISSTYGTYTAAAASVNSMNASFI